MTEAFRQRSSAGGAESMDCRSDRQSKRTFSGSRQAYLNSATFYTFSFKNRLAQTEEDETKREHCPVSPVALINFGH
jgi:hypothetical protein